MIFCLFISVKIHIIQSDIKSVNLIVYRILYNDICCIMNSLQSITRHIEIWEVSWPCQIQLWVDLERCRHSSQQKHGSQVYDCLRIVSAAFDLLAVVFCQLRTVCTITGAFIWRLKPIFGAWRFVQEIVRAESPVHSWVGEWLWQILIFNLSRRAGKCSNIGL